jgi:lipoate-protein ligase B
VACGLTDHGVTSLSQLAERDVSVSELRPLVEARLADVFGLDLSPAPSDVSRGFAHELSAISA